MKEYSIGQMSRRTGVKVTTIRYYEGRFRLLLDAFDEAMPLEALDDRAIEGWIKRRKKGKSAPGSGTVRRFHRGVLGIGSLFAGSGGALPGSGWTG